MLSVFYEVVMKKFGYLIFLALFTISMISCKKNDDSCSCGDENQLNCPCKREQVTPTKGLPKESTTNTEIRKQSILTSHVIRDQVLSKSGKKVILLGEYYYPQIENVDQLETIDKINQEIRTKAESEFAKVFEEGMVLVKDFYEVQIEQNGGTSMLPFVADQMYEITHNDNYIISAKVTSYTNFGGAHPDILQSSYTYDIRTGLLLTAEEILSLSKKEVDALVSQSFYTVFLEQPDAFFEDAGDTLTKQKFEYGFYIREGNIVFYINPYIIAPYAAGVHEISILLEDNSFFSTLDKDE